jgi:hypothetical protein
MAWWAWLLIVWLVAPFCVFAPIWAWLMTGRRREGGN